jgi:hypothetical protein
MRASLNSFVLVLILVLLLVLAAQPTNRERRTRTRTIYDEAKNREGVNLSVHSSSSVELGLSLAFALRNYFVQLEDWQEHRNHNAANDHSKEYDQERLNQRR